MIEMTVEDYFERLEECDSKKMGEKKRINQLIPNQRKIDDKIERVVENLKDNEYFSMYAIARKNHIRETTFKKYVTEWCKDNDRELKVFRGGRKGSMITLLDLKED